MKKEVYIQFKSRELCEKYIEILKQNHFKIYQCAMFDNLIIYFNYECVFEHNTISICNEVRYDVEEVQINLKDVKCFKFY